MEKNIEMKRIAIENLDGDIRILALQTRLKKDTDLIETVIREKLNLLYFMGIINTQTFLIYSETIKALEEVN